MGDYDQLEHEIESLQRTVSDIYRVMENMNRNMINVL